MCDNCIKMSSTYRTNLYMAESMNECREKDMCKLARWGGGAVGIGRELQ